MTGNVSESCKANESLLIVQIYHFNSFVGLVTLEHNFRDLGSLLEIYSLDFDVLILFFHGGLVFELFR